MTIEMMTANMNGGKTRRSMLEGREHIVVPTVMMTSGVVPGSSGPLLYEAAEMKKNPQAWNNRPIVVYHPVNKEGTPTTAADPTVLNTQKVGVVLNSQYTDKNGKPRWKSESWIDVARAKQLIPDVLEKIEKGEVIEVSTGLYTENEEKEGTHNGKKYKAIAKNFVPDHLAILPTGKGACSTADGAGLNANAAKAMKCSSCGGDLCCPGCDKGKQPVANAMSFQKIFQTIQKGLDEKYGPYRVMVQDVYPSFVVYGKRDDNGNRKLFKQDYKVDNRKGESTKVSFSGDSVPVEQITEYRTTDGKFVGNLLYGGNTPKESDMDKNQLVTAIITNSKGELAEADREWLLAKSEQWLKQLPYGTPAAVNPVQPPAPVANAQPVAKPTFQELLASADQATQEAIQEAMSAREVERGKLIQTITANSNNTFTTEQLGQFKLPELRALAKIAAPVVPQQTGFNQPVANWAGAAGFTPPVANGAPAEAPTLPTPPSTRPVK